VVCPSDERELIAALPAVCASGAPCYVRYNNFKPAVEQRAPFVLGRAEVIEPSAERAAGGSPRVALLTYGFLLREVVRARDLLGARRVPARVLDMRTVKPLDEEAVLDAARATGCLVVIEDHFKTGGLYSAVAELLVRAGVGARVHSFALDERWFKPALLPDVLEHEGFTGPRLAERVAALL
jgi:transketolase